MQDRIDNVPQASRSSISAVELLWRNMTRTSAPEATSCRVIPGSRWR
jgi:hypothetical protein